MPITDLVHPLLLAKINRVLAAMASLGYSMRICQGARTAAYQHELWRQGRDIPGPDVSATRPLGRTVTNADGYTSKSNHQQQADGFGHAVDCCFIGTDPWNERGPKQLWDIYGLMCEAVGCRWGGRFARIDRPHAEF